MDAWRLYKDPSINQTIFWNTDFESGNGFVSTAMVTTGLFGVIAWVLFLGLFCWQGVRLLFQAGHSDRFGISSEPHHLWLQPICGECQ